MGALKVGRSWEEEHHREVVRGVPLEVRTVDEAERAQLCSRRPHLTRGFFGARGSRAAVVRPRALDRACLFGGRRGKATPTSETVSEPEP